VKISLGRNRGLILRDDTTVSTTVRVISLADSGRREDFSQAAADASLAWEFFDGYVQIAEPLRYFARKCHPVFRATEKGSRVAIRFLYRLRDRLARERFNRWQMTSSPFGKAHDLGPAFIDTP
jgi:hypothetical protein